MTQTILVAEDSATMRTVAEMAFHGSPYRVITVASGEQAIHAAYEHRPAVIVLDYHLPDRSGVELCRAMQGDPSLRDIPVIVLGGRYHAFSEEDALNAGASAVMTKPYTTDAFVERVTGLARSGAAPRAAAPPPRVAPPAPPQAPAFGARQPLTPPAPPQAAAPPQPRPSRFGGAPPMGASTTNSTSGSMPGLGASPSGNRPRFGGAPAPQLPTPPTPPTPPAPPQAPPQRPRFGGAPPPQLPTPPTSPQPPARTPLGAAPSGGLPSPMRRPDADGSNPSARMPQPPQRPGFQRGPLGPPSGSLGGSPSLSGDESISHDDKTPRPAPLPQAPTVTASDVLPPAPPAPASHHDITPVPQTFSPPAPVAPASVTPPPPAMLAQDVAAAVRSALSQEDIERIVREEVQQVIREQMLTMVKTVLGDLFQERMMPRLLKYGEERINVVFQGGEFRNLLQQAVADELAKLS